MSYKKQFAADFAAHIKSLGFSVYMAESELYGFVTDETESRVLSFSFSDCVASLGGNYGPPSRESGTGWQIKEGPEALRTADDVRRVLYSRPDYHCGNGWKYFSTVAQHLALYGSSSKYRKV